MVRNSRQPRQSGTKYFVDGMTPEQHIATILDQKFPPGRDNEDPMSAIEFFAEDIYQSSAHYIMKLIQNVDDNSFLEEVGCPRVEFMLVKECKLNPEPEAGVLVVSNNEIGFSPNNVESMCSIGNSTKKGTTGKKFIGEKGIGFKSVFALVNRELREHDVSGLCKSVTSTG